MAVIVLFPETEFYVQMCIRDRVYTAIMFFAIKKTPVGKAIMSAIGLLPTSVFMACIYGYDASVTAWIYLSAAWMLKEILTPQEKITWKSYAMILVTFVLGCGAKAVYAPMILIGLLRCV